MIWKCRVLFAVIGHHFGFEVVDESGVFGNLGLSEVDIYLGRMTERFVASRVGKQQMSHDYMAGHLDHAAGLEVDVFVVFGFGPAISTMRRAWKSMYSLSLVSVTVSTAFT